VVDPAAWTLLRIEPGGVTWAARANAGAGLLYRSDDWGETWREWPLPEAVAASLKGSSQSGASAEKVVLQIRADSQLWLSTDAGVTWRAVVIANDFTVDLTRGIDSALWADGSSERRYRSTDDGLTWQPFIARRANTVLWPPAVWFFDRQHGLAVERDGQVSETWDGGASWVIRSNLRPLLGDDARLLPDLSARLQFFAGNVGWLSIGRQLLRSTDAGRSWQAVATPGARAASMAAMDFLDGKRGEWTDWKCAPEPERACSPRLFTTDDGAARWVERIGARPRYSEQGLIEWRQGGAALVSGGEVWFSADDGRSWWPAQVLDNAGAPTALPEHPMQLRWREDSEGWLVTAQRVFRSNDGGRTWRQVVLPARSPFASDLARLVFDGQRVTLLVSLDEAAYASDDGGNSWRLVN
jgi:photosystem II stability/assembly factor-like uncharacterized protein